jgi:hypothetical protein
MRREPPFLIALLFAWQFTAAAQSNGGVTVIDNPGGGTIAYAQMPHAEAIAIGCGSFGEGK